MGEKNKRALKRNLYPGQLARALQQGSAVNCI